MDRWLFLLAGLGLMVGLVHADTALPTTASFVVTAQVVAGCGIVGTSQTSGLDFGTLDFGTHSTVATGELSAVALSGGLPVQIECSPGSTLSITVDAGLHANAGQRRLQLVGQADVVAYALYADAARTQPLLIGQPVSLPVSGTINMPIHGVLTLPGTGLPAGAYADTAQVTLSY